MSVQESIVKIGAPVPLVGVVTEPLEYQEQDLALLLLNSGIMHRVGACRLSVKLARSVARGAGLLCLRFDFSGIGDSDARAVAGAESDEGSLHEVIEAMDYLQNTRGINRFIVYGLCSGALAACNAAEVDERVIAVAQVDGFSYPTWRSRLDYYVSRLWSIEGWRNRLVRWLRGGTDAAQSDSILLGGRADFEVPDFSADPGQKAVSSQLQTMMTKGVVLRCTFTGREPYYRYREQYRDCFSEIDFGNKLSLDYYPFASHIFTQPAYQREMVEGLVGWVKDLKK